MVGGTSASTKPGQRYEEHVGGVEVVLFFRANKEVSVFHRLAFAGVRRFRFVYIPFVNGDRYLPVSIAEDFCRLREMCVCNVYSTIHIMTICGLPAGWFAIAFGNEGFRKCGWHKEQVSSYFDLANIQARFCSLFTLNEGAREQDRHLLPRDSLSNPK